MDEIIHKLEVHLNHLKANRDDPVTFGRCFSDMFEEMSFICDDIDADPNFLCP